MSLRQKFRSFLFSIYFSILMHRKVLKVYFCKTFFYTLIKNVDDENVVVDLSKYKDKEIAAMNVTVKELPADNSFVQLLEEEDAIGRPCILEDIILLKYKIDNKINWSWLV